MRARHIFETVTRQGGCVIVRIEPIRVGYGLVVRNLGYEDVVMAFPVQHASLAILADMFSDVEAQEIVRACESA